MHKLSHSRRLVINRGNYTTWNGFSQADQATNVSIDNYVAAVFWAEAPDCPGEYPDKRLHPTDRQDHTALLSRKMSPIQYLCRGDPRERLLCATAGPHRYPCGIGDHQHMGPTFCLVRILSGSALQPSEAYIACLPIEPTMTKLMPD